MNFTVHVNGLQQIEDALASFGPTLARGAVRKALNVGSRVFLTTAKMLAPVLQTPTQQRKGGELRDAIAEVTTLQASKQKGRARVGLKYEKGKGSQSPGVYGLFVEFGTQNMSAHPYMRPAFDTAKAQAESVFTEEIKRGVEALRRR